MGIQFEQVSYHEIVQATGSCPSGAVTLITGQTGAGKSTLLDLLTGLSKPDEGTITYEGEPLWHRGKVNRNLLKRIGVVFQQPEDQLFATKVKGEFDYSLKPWKLTKEEKRQRTEAALIRMGLDPAILELNPFALSGGTRRKIAMATTLAAAPDWLLLDEPSAGLDAKGIRQLQELLTTWKGKENGGVVIVTHDLDAFLPVADHVLLLDRGRLITACTRDELLKRPQLLKSIGVGLPESLRLKDLLQARGVYISGSEAPEAAAEAIASQLHAPCRSPVATMESACTTALPEPASLQPPDTEAGGPGGMIGRIDPRSLWLLFMLVSAGIFMQRSCSGLLVAGILTALLIGLSRVPLAPVWRGAKAFFLFMAIAAAIAGLRLSPEPGYPFIAFSFQAAGSTLLHVTRLLLVLLLGLTLPLAVSYLRMKKGLEQGLAALSRIGLPVEALALAASLILRFVPVISGEWKRFARIAQARGKNGRRKEAPGIRDLRVMMVPLLFSLIRHAEALSFAMEMRGYTRLDKQFRVRDPLVFSSVDLGVVLLAIILFTGLVFLRFV
ncbi:ATP-binding cassette domain-containing protein [Paenibacillus larvae]